MGPTIWVVMSGSGWWIGTGEDYYAQSPERDPQGPDAGISRVLRGGVDEQRPVSLARHRPQRAAAFGELRHRRIPLRCARTPRYGSAVRKLGTNKAHGRGRQCAMTRTNANSPSACVS